MKQIGFIGLGIMGKPMAKNLLRAGYRLTVFDLNQSSVDEVVKYGAGRADSARRVAETSDIVITMLPNSPHVESVVCGANGILEGAKPGMILIDMSSIAPLASQKIGRSCAAKQIRMIDAPVSGGEPRAADGTLSIMAGGEKEVFEEVYDILMSMGSSAVYCGETGAGNTAKLANQIIVAINIAAVSEAFMMAKRAGADPDMVFRAIKGGLAGSAVMEAKVPMILERNFKPGFRMDLHIKDLNNVLETGHSLGAPLILTSQVMEMMQSLQADGAGEEDHSALVKFYEKISGIVLE